MEINYLSFLFLILAGASKGLMDLISFRFYYSVFAKHGYFNPKNSWRYKWKNGDYTQGERFPFSSTSLVFLTDIWHLLQWIMITFISLAVLFYNQQGDIYRTLIDFLLLRFVFWHIGFWIVYESNLLKKKK